MANSSLILDLLAGIMLVLSVLILGRMRLFSMLSLFSSQSVALAVYAFVAAVSLGESHLFLTALITLVLKGWYIPRILARTARNNHVAQRLQSYLRPASMLFAALLMVVFGFYLSQSLIPMAAPSYLIAAVSVSMTLLGLLMLIIRKGMYGQIIGFLMMENGIFAFGLALTGGIPLIAEFGIFFDVLIGVLIMAALSAQVQKELGTVTTDRLNELVD